MTLLAAVAAVCVVISLGYYAAASVAAMRFWLKSVSPVPPLPKIAPRVAVLKPLHGLSEHLVANIITFLELDYPRTEYVFGVANYEDRAIDVPVALKAQYRFANTTVVVGEEPGAENRKIAKLIRMVDRAPRAEILSLTDADIAVERDHLRRVVGELAANERTGAVTCVYRARPSGGFGARLEALSINTDFAPLVMLSAAIEPIRYALGAGIAVKREALDAIGGFHALKDKLADDYFLGRMVADHGYEVRLSSSIVSTVCEHRSFADYWTHQLRWARTYRTARKASLATILLQGPFWAMIFLIASHFSGAAIAALVAVLAARLGMSALLTWKVLGMPDIRRDLLLVPLKDLIMTAIWFASLFSNRIEWGGRKLIVTADGTMREANG